MKKLLFSILSLASTVALLQADLVIVQKVEGSPEQSGEVTMKIKGDKLRVDVQEQVSVLVNTTTNNMTTLMHEQKMFMEMSSAMLEQMMTMAQAQQQEKPTFKALDKTEEVNGHKAELYSSTMNVNGQNVETTYWVAKEFPNGDKFREAVKLVENSAFGKMSKQMAPQSELPGVPVKTEAKIPGMGTITTTLVSVKEENLDDATFNKPADYKSLEMPAIPAPQGGAAQ